jgi:site-specific recombinase XerD
MDNFKAYLQAKKYRESTVQAHIQNLGYFLKWVASQGIPDPAGTSYNDLLSYVQYEQARQKDVATINLRVSSISQYFDCLKQAGLVSRNPARTLRIKGKAKTVIQHPLDYDALLNLYNQYKSMTIAAPAQLQKSAAAVQQRNMVMLGLMIWQGLHSGELEKLELSHINLNDGTIYIPSTARGNSRELKLSTQQILTLHHYIHGGVRDQQKPMASKLFAGNMHHMVQSLIETLKGINPQVKNALHIRASVILHWLRQHNKRQVQYMAGHRYISSTEAYELQSLETLTDQLSKHHPFG